MNPAWAQVWVAAGVGLLQCGILWYGIKMMGAASEQRNRQLDQQGQALQDIGLGIQELLRRS